MLKRLRLKFVCIMMTIVTIMICVILGLILNFTRNNLENQSIQMMQAIATEPFHMGRPDEPPEGVRLPFFSLHVGAKGEVIATGGGYYDLSDQDFLSELIELSNASKKDSGVISEYNLRYLRTSAPKGQRLIFSDISSEINTMKSLVHTCIIIGILSFLAFLGISLLLARWAVKPVENAWNQQRQFVADASHELKTPLTVITTNAELLQDPFCDEVARSTFAQNILAVSKQMRGLTESLLDLARVDNGTNNMGFADTNLSQVVTGASLPFEAVFFEKGLAFTPEIEPGICVRGSESHIRQVVDILLDNAQKYSYADTEVKLNLRRIGRASCLLTVTNVGDTIAPEDLKNIFKRFYRVDSARSMNQSYGLGLSIAQSIIQTHKGKIWAESKDGVNTFSVQLQTI